MDPAPSLACAIGTTPAATNAPAPDEDAPAVRVGVPRVANRPDPRVFRRRAETELRHLSLAERRQSGRKEDPCERTVGARGPRFPRISALHGRHARDVDVVLEIARYAVEVAAVGAWCVRARASAVEGFVGQTVQRRVDRLGAGDGRLDEFCRRHLARTQCIDKAYCVMVAEGVIAEGRDAGHPVTVPSGTARPSGRFQA